MEIYRNANEFPLIYIKVKKTKNCLSGVVKDIYVKIHKNHCLILNTLVVKRKTFLNSEFTLQSIEAFTASIQFPLSAPCTSTRQNLG
jgi:hypothetical protein